MKRLSRLLAGGALSILLAACGGGGGSDGSGSSAPAVAVSISGPSSVSAELYEGQDVPPATISFNLSGSIASLNGRTVYVFAVMPDPLFTGQPTVWLSRDFTYGTLSLSGVTKISGAGTYSNRITLRVCLDAACSSELPVSNNSIPYTVKVKRGLSVAQSSATLATTFGTMPAAVTVAMSPPENLLSWSVEPATWISKTFMSVRGDKAPDGSNTIVLSATELAASNSTRNETIVVKAQTTDGQTLYRYIDVAYRTSASSLAHAFIHPDGISFTDVQGVQSPADSSEGSVLFAAPTSDKFKHVGTAFTWPPAAENDPRRDKWLYLYLPDEISSPRWPGIVYTAQAQRQACYSGACLPAGHYSALVHYTYSPVGQPVEDVYYTITLDITP